MKLPGKKKIVRLVVTGSINMTTEVSDSKATAICRDLARRQELEIIAAIGEKKWKQHQRDLRSWYKNPYNPNRPSLPWNEHPFPLNVKIT